MNIDKAFFYHHCEFVKRLVMGKKTGIILQRTFGRRACTLLLLKTTGERERKKRERERERAVAAEVVCIYQSVTGAE